MRKTLSSLFLFVILLKPASAQKNDPVPPAHHHPAQETGAGQDTSMTGMNMPGMRMEASGISQLPSPHAGSGTGWQPASVPGHEWMLMRGGWELMAHGVIFVGYNQQG